MLIFEAQASYHLTLPKNSKSGSSSDEMDLIPIARFKTERKDKEKGEKKRRKASAREASLINGMNI